MTAQTTQAPDWRTSFYPTDIRPCVVCGSVHQIGIEPRYGYAVCEEHAKMSAIEVSELVETRNAPVPPLFYLQDSRSYAGNSMMWWRRGGGYTSNVMEAEAMSGDRVVAQNQCRHTDIPWPKDYIDARTHVAVDVQRTKREAIAEAGIALAVAPPEPKEKPSNCVGCGRWLSDSSRYTCSGCPNCGADNRP